MITKIQKLSAIHNLKSSFNILKIVVYDYKDTKIISNSQPNANKILDKQVVYDVKDTKIVSNSQPISIRFHDRRVVYDYKDTKIVSNS